MLVKLSMNINKFKLIKQIFARMTGPILKVIATGRCLPAILGVTARGHAPHLELISPVSTARKKMYMSKVYTVGNILG